MFWVQYTCPSGHEYTHPRMRAVAREVAEKFATRTQPHCPACLALDPPVEALPVSTTIVARED